jgi:hypothetical protein
MAQRTWHFLSFREKYQCPEEGRAKPESSPSTQTCKKDASSRWRAWWFSSLTDRALGRVSGYGVVKVLGSVIFIRNSRDLEAKITEIQKDAIKGQKSRGLLKAATTL